MNILHVINSSGLYGAERILLELVDVQVKNNNNVFICLIVNYGENKPDELIDEITNQGFDYFIKYTKKGLDTSFAKYVYTYCRSNNIDIIHSHNYKPNILLAIKSICSREFHLVTTMHGWTSTKIFSRKFIYEIIEVVLLNFFDNIIIVSQKMLKNPRMLFIINKKKINYIPNAISVKKRSTQKDIYQNITCDYKNRFIIGSIGRFSKEKGFNDLINAISGLKDEIPDILLILIGDGAERVSLEALIKNNNLEKYICITGYLCNAEQYIKLFDVFILSSYSEGMPVVILEAMAYGKPIISTSVGAIPDILDDGKSAIFIEPGNVNSIMSGIKKLHDNNNLRDSISKTAKRNFNKSFSTSVMYDSYLKIYEETYT